VYAGEREGDREREREFIKVYWRYSVSKRPTTESKETYYSIKRDLLQGPCAGGEVARPLQASSSSSCLSASA